MTYTATVIREGREDKPSSFHGWTLAGLFAELSGYANVTAYPVKSILISVETKTLTTESKAT